MRRGRQVEVPSPGQNQKVAAFGGINYATGKHLAHVPDVAKGGKNSVQFLAWLSKLLDHADRSGNRILLALDNGSIHTARKVQAVLAAPEVRKRVRIIWLPKYAPELNEQERVWKYAKSHGIANVLFSGREKLRDQVARVLAAVNHDPRQRMTLVLGHRLRQRRIGKNILTGT